MDNLVDKVPVKPHPEDVYDYAVRCIITQRIHKRFMKMNREVYKKRREDYERRQKIYQRYLELKDANIISEG